MKINSGAMLWKQAGTTCPARAGSCPPLLLEILSLNYEAAGTVAPETEWAFEKVQTCK